MINIDINLLLIQKKNHGSLITIYSDKNSVRIRWARNISKWENLFSGVTIDTTRKKKALLLHFAGDDLFKIYQTLLERAGCFA